ncbi:MAG: hypothetical protein RIQ41_135 [Candidatus Parcubacteria bacterium]|jgi:ribulose-phosphate 3-epimerase
MQITPAILPHSFEEIQEKLSRVEGIVTRVQIDLCDGVFGRERTWLPDGTESLSTSFSYEFDVMVTDWRTPTANALSLGASCIVMHVDLFSDEDMQELITLVSPYAIPLGIAVSHDKSVDFHADMVRKARELYSPVFIQVMGIRNVGEQGQLFEEEAVDRIRALKQQFGDVAIQVDGGMTPETAKKIFDAGAETAVVGSYIFGGEDPGAAIKHLESITLDATC